MDSVASWKNAGAGFAGTPSNRQTASSSSSSKPRKPLTQPRRPSSSSSSSHKQALLFSRDKTPLITPRTSTSSIKPKQVQSTLSMGPSSSNARKPLKEKGNTVASSRSAPIKRVGGEWVISGGGSAGGDTGKGKGKAVSQQITSSNSSTEDSHISRALLKNNNTASKWKGQLFRNASTSSSSTSTFSASNAHRILDTKNSRRGPTIDFDGPDLPYDDEEMRGETQRRRKRKEDRGGWGKLDLVNAEEEEEQEESSGRRPASEGSRKRPKLEELELSSSEADEGEREMTGVIEQDFEEPPTTRPSYTLPRPPPSRLTSRPSHNRSTSFHSTQSSGSGSAEEMQALLVPYNQKRPARILVPDSDGPTPPNLSDMEDGEEPDTEAETEDEMMGTAKGGNAQDDSGFVEASNIIELLDSSSPPRQPEFNEEEEDDDNVSIPDSQPSVASHLSLLGSSSPMRFVETVLPIRPLKPLQPTESGILMPPPPALPRKRLRRGPPPRPTPPSSPPHSSRILVEDTQTQNQQQHYHYDPYPIDPTGFYVEETQYPDSISLDPLLTGMYWKLPSDLPVLDSDQIVLPSPKPLRPSKEKPLDPPPHIETEPMPFPLPNDLPLSPSRPVSSPPPPPPQTIVGKGTDWNVLDQAWKGSKPLTPPPPPAPRQSRLTDHFHLEPNAKEDGEVVVEDSQNQGELSLMQVFGRAVRDSITGIGGLKAEREEAREGKMHRVREEAEEEICSSPLSSLSSLPPSPAPSDKNDLRFDAEKQEVVMDLEEEEEVIPDSDPEDDAPILAGRKGGIVSPLGTPLRHRFPAYELPLDVVEEEEGGGGGEGREETQWESYWTLGSTAPQLTPPSQRDEGQHGFQTKTVAQMLLEAPDVDLPEDWYEDEGGELVSRRHIDLEEGDLE